VLSPVSADPDTVVPYKKTNRLKSITVKNK